MNSADLQLQSLTKCADDAATPAISSPLGQPPSDWRLVWLREITTRIGSGATPTGGQSAYIAKRAKFALVRSQNIYDRHFNSDGLAFISDDQAAALRGAQLRPGDVLLNITGDGITFGRSAKVPESVLPACVNQHVSIIRVDPAKADPDYVLSYLTHPEIKSYIESFNAGGSRRAVTKAHIEAFVVPLPPLAEQRAIGQVLGVLDNKIELNRRMNWTLEELVAALYRSWFVDFDPVVAKSAGRQPAHLRSELAALFPATFQDSPLGSIPHGWEVKTVEDIARYVNGRAFTKGATGTGRMVIRIAELNSGVSGSTVYNDVAAAPENVAQPGDLLFAWSGSLDVYRWCRDEAIINQHIFKVVCEKYPQWFVHQQLREAMPFFQDIAADKATTMGHIKREHLSQAFLALPPEKLLKAANDAFQPLYAKQLANERESLTLAALRDTLLPKLLSGEIRVNEAEKMKGVSV